MLKRRLHTNKPRKWRRICVKPILCERIHPEMITMPDFKSNGPIIPEVESVRPMRAETAGGLLTSYLERGRRNENEIFILKLLTKNICFLDKQGRLGTDHFYVEQIAAIAADDRVNDTPEYWKRKNIIDLDGAV
ncbi:hypothetical protein EVAR_45852_1 [Eumeta japonica]|uniref:Uncharacterized protein n=1 Tax=Eumeta variegata TaxID=151549 RepID=A0A4C1WLW1_EUMVA|nr:hypothetical protein EVAR_45852_1 [Eumeta japonica]